MGFCIDPIVHFDEWRGDSCDSCRLKTPLKEKKGQITDNPDPTVAGTVINRSSRLLISFIRGGDGRCVYCQREVRLDVPMSHHARATIDHRVPKGRGGSKGVANQVLACRRCNYDKGDFLEEEWVERWYDHLLVEL